MTLELGSHREVWFRHNGEKRRFKIRDDAYARGAATLGRTLRLGEPIDTGPQSAEQQTDWSGGIGQTRWNDQAMVLASDMDTTDPGGAVRPWPGISGIGLRGSGSDGAAITAMAPAHTGTTPTDVPLLYADNLGGLYRILLDGTGGATIATYSGGDYVRCMAPEVVSGTPTGSTPMVLMGMQSGIIKQLNCSTWTTTDISPTFGGSASIRAMAQWNRKVVVAKGATLGTRDYTGSEVFVKLCDISEVNYINSLAVVGNLIYFTGQASGTRSFLYVTDGTTVTRLHTFHNAYVQSVVAHQGAVYVLTREFVYSSLSAIRDAAVLYRYASGSIQEVFSTKDRDAYGSTENTNNDSGPLTTWGNYVVWPYLRGHRLIRSMNGSTVSKYGVMLYDPARDAVHVGPSITTAASGVRITALTEWHGELAFGIKTSTYAHLGFTNPHNEVWDPGWVGSHQLTDIETATKKMRVVASVFDGGMPHIDKVWLRLNVKTNLHYRKVAGPPALPALKVYVRGDVALADDEFHLIGTYSGNASSSDNGQWTTITYPVMVNGEHLRSKQVQYALELEYPAPATGLTDFPENATIEAVTVEYMLPPSPRTQWRLRIVCEDAQGTFAGTPNPLTTAAAQADWLRQMWADGVPVGMWEPTTAISDSGLERVVMVTDIQENSYRVSSDTGETAIEVGLTLYEVSETPAYYNVPMGP